MCIVTLASNWPDEKLRSLVVRRRKHAKIETDLLTIINTITKEQWADETYRWWGKELKEQVKYAQQNVKCCNMLLDYFDGKIARCTVSKELDTVFSLCCAEL